MLKRSLLAVTLIASTPALAQDAGTVVATVDEAEITLGQMIAMKQQLPPEAAAMPQAALWDLMLDQIIRQTAVAAAGEAQMDAGDVARLELDRRSYLASRALEGVAEAEPSEDEIATAYSAVFGDAEPEVEYSAAHILLETREAADAIKAQLDEGVDFGKMAEERSVGPTAPNKGDLGWFAANRMVKPFAEAVEAMEIGDVSDPVETQFGWHIIKLNDKRMKEPPQLEEVRDQLIMQIRRQYVADEMQRLVDAAKVERVEGLTPSLLDNTDLLKAR